MLHYIHVQGREAPQFFFRDKSAQNFKSVIQSLTDGSSLVISSLYRTDVFYTANEDHSADVLKLWSLQEKSFEPSRLTLISGRDDALELFFTSLVSLSAASQWYESYLEEFRHACSMDQNNPILKDLKLCEQYLQSSKQTIARPVSGSNQAGLLPSNEVFEDLVKHINDFLN
ncbi:hypothetical protein [Ekhidna sp.]|uniref:hypothetical protein n=1 Tax=Ekhidna sp. TaxID=2608089 RepID=UPI003297B714